MTDKLRLGPLPKTEVVRLTIAVSVKVKADLDRYAELYAAAYGEPVDTAALVPHMLAAFMERDRVFRRARQSAGAPRDGKGPPESMAEANSSAKDSPSEASSSR